MGRLPAVNHSAIAVARLDMESRVGYFIPFDLKLVNTNYIV